MERKGGTADGKAESNNILEIETEITNAAGVGHKVQIKPGLRSLRVAFILGRQFKENVRMSVLCIARP